MSYTLLNPSPSTLGSLLVATATDGTTAGNIDNETLGAHITLAAGTWLLWGSAQFNGVNSSSSNNQISFGTSSSGWSRSHQRIWCAQSYWTELTNAYVVSLSVQTEVYVRMSSSIIRGCSSQIRAIRLA